MRFAYFCIPITLYVRTHRAHVCICAYLCVFLLARLFIHFLIQMWKRSLLLFPAALFNTSFLMNSKIFLSYIFIHLKIKYLEIFYSFDAIPYDSKQFFSFSRLRSRFRYAQIFYSTLVFFTSFLDSNLFHHLPQEPLVRNLVKKNKFVFLDNFVKLSVCLNHLSFYFEFSF